MLLISRHDTSVSITDSYFYQPPPGDIGPITYWSIVEINGFILCACIPGLRDFARRACPCLQRLSPLRAAAASRVVLSGRIRTVGSAVVRRARTQFDLGSSSLGHGHGHGTGSSLASAGRWDGAAATTASNGNDSGVGVAGADGLVGASSEKEEGGAAQAIGDEKCEMEAESEV